jgi:maleylacetate reductase
MHSFVYEPNGQRVVFGAGRFGELAQEASRLGKRLLVLTTPGRTDIGQQACDLLGELAVGVHAGAVMHVPQDVADAATEKAQARGADGLVAVGGGSAIGLAKAVALRTGLPILAAPTTYAGSEMTPIWGLTEAGVKQTGKDAGVLPRVVIYDPLLTLGLPPAVSAVSGLNAIAHCVEGLYSQSANPLVSIMAEEGIRALAKSLPRLVGDPSDVEARGEALYGAWMAGTVLGSAGMALHHKLCHTLGGSFNLPHAETHAIVLPHAAAYNAAAAPEAMAKVARALGTADGPQGLYELLVQVGAPRGLKALGMPAEGLDRVVELTLTNPYYNPAPLDAGRLRRLLQDAFEGVPPRRDRASAA